MPPPLTPPLVFRSRPLESAGFGYGLAHSWPTPEGVAPGRAERRGSDSRRGVVGPRHPSPTLRRVLTGAAAPPRTPPGPPSRRRLRGRRSRSAPEAAGTGLRPRRTVMRPDHRRDLPDLVRRRRVIQPTSGASPPSAWPVEVVASGDAGSGVRHVRPDQGESGAHVVVDVQTEQATHHSRLCCHGWRA